MSVDKRLYLEDLTVSFDGFKALNKLSLYVDPGEMLCIIGPNGAGKTTMMDVITGKTKPDSGTAWFGDGIDLLRLSEPQIVASGIARKFQKPTVFEQLTVFENLELALAGTRSFLKTFRARISPTQHQRITGKDTRARSEAVARNRHAADAEPGIATRRRAGGRHDAARNRAYG
jgi:urea transport system ATP-binding protein